MEDIANSVLLDTLMKALYAVASRRTSKKFADETIGSTIKTLERKYDQWYGSVFFVMQK